jgi:hypothetical protein
MRSLCRHDRLVAIPPFRSVRSFRPLHPFQPIRPIRPIHVHHAGVLAALMAMFTGDMVCPIKTTQFAARV